MEQLGDIVVRKAAPQDCPDADRLNALVLRRHHEALPHIFKPSQTAPVWADAKFADEQLLLTVAEADGAVVGLLEAICFDPPPEVIEHLASSPVHLRRVAFIQNIVAEPQGRGIGTALLEFAEAWAISRGAEAIELGSSAFNTQAHAFYGAHGFEPLSIMFSKRLADPQA